MGDQNAQNTADFLQELKEQAARAETETEEKPSNTYTDTDGTMYEWDPERRAWFPKVDEDFIAAYQMSYGFITTDEETQATEKQEAAVVSTNRKTVATFDPEHKAKQEEENAGNKPNKKRKANEANMWFELEDSKNTNIYVSGLPPDITEEEFVTLMSKYGIIMEDMETNKLKVKLYQDESGKNKGDARCCYLKIESVALAIQMLDEMEYRKHTLHVEQAKFQLKGNYNPALKPKKKKKKKKKQGQEKLLDWVDRDHKRPKCERIIVFKNMFDPKEFEKDPSLITEIRDDLKSECEKFGEVKKVIVFDRNPEGIASVAFQEFDAADKCVPFFNGRWFGGRRIVAEKWDGASSFKIEETEQEKEERLKKWEEFLQES